MNPSSALIVIVMVGLWVAYLVPTVLRRRQHMMEARAEDRFSENLRVVAVCEQEQGAVESEFSQQLSSTGALLSPPLGSTKRAPSALAKGVAPMASSTRPTLTPARLDVLARRRAAARRRGNLFIGLFLATVTVLGLSLITPVSAWFALIPGALVVCVVIMGRRTVVANERADKALVQRQRATQFAGRELSAVERKLAGRPAPAVRPGAATLAGYPAEDLQTVALTPAESRFFAQKNVTGRPVNRLDQLDQQTARPKVAAAGGASDAPKASAASAPPATGRVPLSAPGPIPAPDPAARRQTPGQQALAQHPPNRQAPAQQAPRYVVRTAAARWEPPSITTELRKLTAEHMEKITREAQARENLAQDAETDPQDTKITDSLGVNLNSILARRRVV